MEKWFWRGAGFWAVITIAFFTGAFDAQTDPFWVGLSKVIYAAVGYGLAAFAIMTLLRQRSQ